VSVESSPSIQSTAIFCHQFYVTPALPLST
jgi:hypothetical protein